MWHVDREDYRRAYLAAVEAAPQALTPDLAGILSVPQPVVLHSRYFRARNRILVMGQETSQNWMPLLAPSPEADWKRQPWVGADWARRAWAGQVGNVIDFDYAYGLPAAHHRFWQAFEQIRDIFGLPSGRSLAWSNIWKVQRIDVQHRPGLGNLAGPGAPDKRMAVINWQAELFRAEMKYINPDAILFMTGGQHWVLSHMYPPAGPFNPRGDWQPVTINGLDIPAAWTRQPNAMFPADVLHQARHDAASYLLDELERRGRPRDGSLLDPFAD